MKRKIEQLLTVSLDVDGAVGLVALDSDGNVWRTYANNFRSTRDVWKEWEQIPPLPEKEKSTSKTGTVKISGLA